MTFLVAVSGDEIVGGPWPARRRSDGQDLAWICDIHVDPQPAAMEWRGC